MPKLIITDLKPYVGEYDIPSAYTNREYNRIKQISGVRAGELEEASSAGDMAVLVALAAIVLTRHGVPNVDMDILWDATESNFDVVKTPEDKAREDAERPLASEDLSGTAGGSSNENDEPTRSDDAETSSGASGNGDGENSQLSPTASGDPGSETFADSGRATLES